MGDDEEVGMARGPWSIGFAPVGNEQEPDLLREQIFQFCGLMWATEYNALHAGIDRGVDAQTVNGMNTLLTAYAAFEALVLETALCVAPPLYEDRSFRRAGLSEKCRALLGAMDRGKEELPAVIAEISEHRRALTHSEPHNERTARLGTVISGTDAARFAREVRAVAEWIWNGQRPGPVASAFDEPNVFLPNPKTAG
jgi:hypothetical protein